MDKLKIEKDLRKQGYKYIAGVDEAGIGAFAGGFSTCALILDPDKPIIKGVDDSKKLSKVKRLKLEPIIKEQALAYCLVYVTAKKINDAYTKKNGASGYFRRLHMWAMRKAVQNIGHETDFVIVDHYKIPSLDIPQEAIQGGDKLSATIGAASILAKCYRDRIMLMISKKYPNYSHWKSTVGYRSHFEDEALELYGMTPEHRIGFVKSFLNNRNKKG